MDWFVDLKSSTRVGFLNEHVYDHAITKQIQFKGCESNVRLVMISLDKHPTFIGLINESCSISTVKQIFISTFCLNGYTMVGTDLRLLYEAEDLFDQTGLLAERARQFFAYTFGPIYHLDQRMIFILS